MKRQNEDKLKFLLENVPPGFLVDTPWLASRKIDRKLAHWYLKRGWLERVVQGVYRRPFTSNKNRDAGNGWKTIVLSVQWLMGYDVHLGGRTALSFQGFRHYLNFGESEVIYLYGDSPTWLKRLPTGQKFVTRSRVLFQGEPVGVEEAQLSNSGEGAMESPSLSPWQWPLTVSSPERAILEMINEIPKTESFHMVDTLFEGLVNLRPDLLAELLHVCRSVKVKRYFFVFADRYNHAWRKYLSVENFDLGSGPRFVFEGGRIHPDYRISVPEDFMSRLESGGEDGP